MPNVLDLSGSKFSKITAIEICSHKPRDSCRSINWKCVCDCGNTVIVSSANLRSGRIISCGCTSLAKSISRISPDYENKAKFYDGTIISRIESKTINKNNSSGESGVFYEKCTNKWKVSIGFKRKRIYLGRYANKEDAIKARKLAEKKYYNPVIEQYYEENVKEAK